MRTSCPVPPNYPAARQLRPSARRAVITRARASPLSSARWSKSPASLSLSLARNYRPANCDVRQEATPRKIRLAERLGSARARARARSPAIPIARESGRCVRVMHFLVEQMRCTRGADVAGHAPVRT